jgi:hypothetical protein
LVVTLLVVPAGGTVDRAVGALLALATGALLAVPAGTLLRAPVVGAFDDLTVDVFAVGVFGVTVALGAAGGVTGGGVGLGPGM